MGLFDYVEVSASENINIDEIFFKVALRAFKTEKALQDQDE